MDLLGDPNASATASDTPHAPAGPEGPSEGGPVDPSRHRCQLCSNHYLRKSDLKVHMRLHTGERPFKCKHCDMRLAKRSHRERHESTHSKTKAFKCSNCQRTYHRADDLKTHLRSHTGERPYACSMCTKTYITSSHLQTHIKSHAEAKFPHKCKLCDKAYATRGGLSTHILSHNRKGKGRRGGGGGAAPAPRGGIGALQGGNLRSRINDSYTIGPQADKPQPGRFNAGRRMIGTTIVNGQDVAAPIRAAAAGATDVAGLGGGNPGPLSQQGLLGVDAMSLLPGIPVADPGPPAVYTREVAGTGTGTGTGTRGNAHSTAHHMLIPFDPSLPNGVPAAAIMLPPPPL